MYLVKRLFLWFLFSISENLTKPTDRFCLKKPHRLILLVNSNWQNAQAIKVFCVRLKNYNLSYNFIAKIIAAVEQHLAALKINEIMLLSKRW